MKKKDRKRVHDPNDEPIAFAIVCDFKDGRVLGVQRIYKDGLIEMSKSDPNWPPPEAVDVVPGQPGVAEYTKLEYKKLPGHKKRCNRGCCRWVGNFCVLTC